MGAAVAMCPAMLLLHAYTTRAVVVVVCAVSACAAHAA